MIFQTKEEKIENLEKKLFYMEKRMDENIQKMDKTITTLREIILRLQSDNTQLRSERDFLIERHKKMLKRVPVPDLAAEIREKFVKPAAGKIRENSEFIQLLAKEGLVRQQDAKQLRQAKPAQMKEKEVDPSVTAKELKEHIEEVKPSYGKTIDNFFELVRKNGKIRSDEAARKLNVHPIQIEEWSKILESHELVTIKKIPIGKLEIAKV